MEIEGILFVILTDETASPLIENKISSGCVVIALLFFNSFIFILEIFSFSTFVRKIYLFPRSTAKITWP